MTSIELDTIVPYTTLATVTYQVLTDNPDDHRKRKGTVNESIFSSPVAAEPVIDQFGVTLAKKRRVEHGDKKIPIPVFTQLNGVMPDSGPFAQNKPVTHEEAKICRQQIMNSLQYTGIAFHRAENGIIKGTPNMTGSLNRIASVISGNHSMYGFNVDGTRLPVGARVRWTLPKLKEGQVQFKTPPHKYKPMPQAILPCLEVVRYGSKEEGLDAIASCFALMPAPEDAEAMRTQNWVYPQLDALAGLFQRSHNVEIIHRLVNRCCLAIRTGPKLIPVHNGNRVYTPAEILCNAIQIYTPVPPQTQITLTPINAALGGPQIFAASQLPNVFSRVFSVQKQLYFCTPNGVLHDIYANQTHLAATKIRECVENTTVPANKRIVPGTFWGEYDQRAGKFATIQYLLAMQMANFILSKLKDAGLRLAYREDTGILHVLDSEFCSSRALSDALGSVYSNMETIHYLRAVRELGNVLTDNARGSVQLNLKN